MNKRFAVFHSNYEFVKNFRSLEKTFDSESEAEIFIYEKLNNKKCNPGWFYELVTIYTESDSV